MESRPSHSTKLNAEAHLGQTQALRWWRGALDTKHVAETACKTHGTVLAWQCERNIIKELTWIELVVGLYK